MGCFDEQTYAMYADGELTEGEAQLVQTHLSECQNCRKTVAALEEENRAFVHAFQEVDIRDNLAHFAPEYSLGRAAGRRTAGELVLAVLALAATLRAATGVIAGVELPAGLDWLNPFGLSGQLNYLLTSIVYLIDEGGPMLMSVLNSLSFAAIVGLICLGAFAMRRRLTGIGAGTLTAAIVVVAVFSSHGYAIDVRSSQGGRPLTIASGEVIDDTLIAVGESVIVDGTINGDLIAAARRVTINGRVLGDVISAGQLVEVTGTVEGNVFGFGQTVQVRGPIRNLYAFGQNISVSSDTLAGNATLFGETLSVEGFVGKDVTAFGRGLEIRGNVGSDITFYGRNLTLLAPANVGGNLSAVVPLRELVVVSDGATVAGSTNIRVSEPPRSRYDTVWFYVFQVIRLGAAFVTGMALFWLAPALSRLNLDRSALLKAGGLGFLTAVATPVAAVVVGLTLIGLPIALVLFVLWCLGLYLAKVVLAGFLGRSILSAEGTPVALTLLAGLVLIVVAINLPYVGGLVNLLFTLVGLGIILLVAYRRFPRGAQI